MILEFKNGLTVKELKELIKEWPETNSDGSDTQVYLGDAGGYSNVAVELSTLDESDLFISHGAN